MNCFCLVDLKEEEVKYLKTKIREAIEEYEQARRAEGMAKQESNKLVIEVHLRD